MNGIGQKFKQIEFRGQKPALHMIAVSDIHEADTGACREIDGFIVVDKPADMTSAGVVNRLKRISGVKKAGHTGTLDPFATGVMICPVNRATRLAQFFLHSAKAYSAVIHLGIETDTQDYTGNPIATVPVGDISEERIRSVFEGFVGEIDQTPPVYSALKHKGIPLYRYARKGVPVEKPARRVVIMAIDIVEIRLPEIRFSVTCAAGTYIRTLCADIGKALGCGGHLKSLTRTKSGGFSLDDAVSLADLKTIAAAGRLDSVVIPMADALKGMPSHMADPKLMEKIRFGRPLTTGDIGIPTGMDANRPRIKIVDAGRDLLAVVALAENKLQYDYCCVFHSA